MKKSLQVLSLLSILNLVACGPVQQANTHLGSLDDTSQKMLEEFQRSQQSLAMATEQSKRIADALVELKNIGVDFAQIIQSTFKKTSSQPDSSDDIDDVLGNPTPGEQP